METSRFKRYVAPSHGAEDGNSASSMQIMSAPLPRHSKGGTAKEMDVEPTLLAEPSPDDADSLVSSNEPDDLANEQTWPTEEEMSGPRLDRDDSAGNAIPDAKDGTTPKRVKKVPKGTSEYQAAWIIDDGDDEEDHDDDEEEDGQEMVEEEEMVEFPIKDDEDMETDGRKSVAFQDLDAEEEDRQYVCD